MHEPDLLGEVRVAGVLQLGVETLDVLLRTGDDLPDAADGVLEVVQVPVLDRDGLLPVPLVHVGAVVMVEKVVLPDRAHVGEKPLTGLKVELLQRHPLPLRRGLNDLSFDRVEIAIVRDAELNGSPGAVPVQHVVDPAVGLHDQRNLDHHQVELLAQVLFDVVLHGVDGVLRESGREERFVIVGEHAVDLFVRADPRAGEVGPLFLGDIGCGHRRSGGVRGNKLPVNPARHAPATTHSTRWNHRVSGGFEETSFVSPRRGRRG